MPAGSEGPETGASLAPLDEAASLPLQEALGSPPFKILHSFVSKTPELAQMLVPALTEASGPEASSTSDHAGRSGGEMNPPSEQGVSGFLKTLRREAETFTEKGFYFPASVSVGHRDGNAVGPPVGLKLNVNLGYGAAFGTLMVDARVRSPRLAEDATVKCAVHYVKEGGSFWEFFEDDRM